MCSTYNKKLQNSQIKTHENEGNWVDWGEGWDTGKDGESVRNRANATKMENARAKQSKTWKISISGYGMKKRFLLVRNMAQTYESHRLQKYIWDYLSLVTLSLVFYLFMLFMLSLFVLVLVFLVAAWAPITNHCAILFQLYHLKNRSIFPFHLRCCSVLFFFSISFIVFFYSVFFPHLECYYGSFDLNCSNSMRSQHIRLDEIQNADMWAACSTISHIITMRSLGKRYLFDLIEFYCKTQFSRVFNSNVNQFKIFPPVPSCTPTLSICLCVCLSVCVQQWG